MCILNITCSAVPVKYFGAFVCFRLCVLFFAQCYYHLNSIQRKCHYERRGQYSLNQKDDEFMDDSRLKGFGEGS
jgi:hypothetical protein